jgi:hypothetical protein
MSEGPAHGSSAAHHLERGGFAASLRDWRGLTPVRSREDATMPFTDHSVRTGPDETRQYASGEILALAAEPQKVSPRPGLRSRDEGRH